MGDLKDIPKLADAITPEQLIKSVKSLDPRFVTAIKVERWVAALNEFHNTDFRCTVQELQALSEANNNKESYAELNDEEKLMQHMMNEKIELVKIIAERLPRMFGHIIPLKKG